MTTSNSRATQLALRIAKLATDRQLTVATAESLTSGLISSTLEKTVEAALRQLLTQLTAATAHPADSGNCAASHVTRFVSRLSS
jgi:hypothetical protein